MTQIWAHRGASGYAPENTLPAFALAIEQQADGIELDVQLTKDGELVVCHDETLSRTSNGKGYLTHHTLAELKKLNFNKKHKDYGNVPIPTLKEVYELTADADIVINVELKTSLFPYPGIEEKVIKLTKELGMEARVIYSSFNHFTLQRLRELNPEVNTGMLFQDCPVQVSEYMKWTGADAIHAPLYYFREYDLISDCRSRNIPLRVWTVNEETYMHTLKAAGVDAIITNYPDVARKA